jgi:cytochrome c biogenesis protein ResB
VDQPEVVQKRQSSEGLRGEVVKEATIAVNAPLSYGGYEFYQSDWRASDLDYSGLKIVRDPGLGLVYAGMIMLSAGVIFVFYIRPRIVATDKHG